MAKFTLGKQGSKRKPAGVRGKGEIKPDAEISAKLRAEVLARNDFTCQMCGISKEEINPYTGHVVRFRIGFVKGKNLGGTAKLSNLRALCSTCYRGARHITEKKPSLIWLLSQIRRAYPDDQRVAYDWLCKKFG